MTSLTKVAITARKIIRYTIFFIVFLTVGKILLGIGISVYKSIFPSPPPPPTVKFGKLTTVPFPKKNDSPKLTYNLETAQGGFPEIPGQAKVYFMPKLNPNLLSLDVAKEKAKSLGFIGNPQQESESLYKFPNPDNPSYLEMNIVTGTFSISYDLSSDRSPIDTRPVAAEISASEFRSLLSGASTLPDDLTGQMVPGYFKLENGKLVSALSLSGADVVKVNLFRKNYDNLPSMTANPDEANVWAIVSGSQDKAKQIIASEYHYYPVDESQYSTYPIKTPQEAFGQLQAGGAYIATMGKHKDGDNVTIRKVYLAYFDPEEESDFYQPIYVFDSDDTASGTSFVAYVPAVSSDYYGR